METFAIRWASENETPVGRVTFVEAESFADAMWEATRLLRAKITGERAAVEAGLYGNGFTIEQAD